MNKEPSSPLESVRFTDLPKPKPHPERAMRCQIVLTWATLAREAPELLRMEREIRAVDPDASRARRESFQRVEQRARTG